jgi:hypothetical protein
VTAGLKRVGLEKAWAKRATESLIRDNPLIIGREKILV